jgi:hypothetical protein
MSCFVVPKSCMADTIQMLPTSAATLSYVVWRYGTGYRENQSATSCHGQQTARLSTVQYNHSKRDEHGLCSQVVVKQWLDWYKNSSTQTVTHYNMNNLTSGVRKMRNTVL